jgi:hypothetical protein
MKMETKQIVEMLAKMQEMMDANLKEMLVKMDANHVKMMAMLNAYREKSTAWLGKTEASLECKEPMSKEMEPEAEHRGFSKEHAAVNSSRTMKKRHMGRHIAAGRRRKPKKLARGYCGFRGMLVAVCRKVPHHAVVAWRRRNIFKNIRTQGNCGPRNWALPE